LSWSCRLPAGRPEYPLLKGKDEESERRTREDFSDRSWGPVGRLGKLLNHSDETLYGLVFKYEF